MLQRAVRWRPCGAGVVQQQGKQREGMGVSSTERAGHLLPVALTSTLRGPMPALQAISWRGPACRL